MGKVWSPAKTRPHGKDPAYNRKTGSRREGPRLAAEAVRAMTARTTQRRPSKGPLGERGRRLQERLGVVPLAAITRRGAVPVWLRASWSNPAVAAKAASQPANCRRHEGLVEEPVAAHAVGNAVADMRSLPAGLGKTQRPVDRGAEETDASRLARAAHGASRLPDQFRDRCQWESGSTAVIRPLSFDRRSSAAHNSIDPAGESPALGVFRLPR